MRSVWLVTSTAICIGAAALILSCASASTGRRQDAVDPEAAPEEPWLSRRARGTHLTTRGPSFERAPPVDLSGTPFVPVSYASGDLKLFAALAMPPKTPETPDTPTERTPAVMLLHSGFAMRASHLAWADPFLRAGFAVFMPTVRGENGNPGDYELWFSEVDDVRAASRWLASQPDIDVDRMYLFGHSAGGALASLVALGEDSPFRIIATSNGVYAASTFGRWYKDEPARVPFDVADLFERQLRALVPNAHELKHALVIYAGSDDVWTQEHARMVKARAPDRVEIVQVPGDHGGSTQAALAKFLERALADAEGGARSPRPTGDASRSAP